MIALLVWLYLLSRDRPDRVRVQRGSRASPGRRFALDIPVLTVPCLRHVRISWPATIKPRGDQGPAIEQLVRGMCWTAKPHQVLLGVTGSGKTFTMAKVIEAAGPAGADSGAQQDAGGAALQRVQAPFSRTTRWSISSATTITTSRKHTCRRAIPTSRRKRRSTTISTSCASRRRGPFSNADDCVIIASVSCIYGIGSPEAYYGMLLMLKVGDRLISIGQLLAGFGGAATTRRNDQAIFIAWHVPCARRHDRTISGAIWTDRAWRYLDVRRRDRGDLSSLIRSQGKSAP